MSGVFVPLDRLMARFAAEAGTLEAAGIRVEEMVGDLVARSEGPVPRDLQELDLLVQSMRDLAAFFETLSRTAPEMGIDLTPALAALKLGFLRERLSGTLPNEPESEGEILF